MTADEANFEPIAMPLNKAVQWSGLSRTTLYRLAAAGRIRMVKAGTTTLVDCASVRALIATLPEWESEAPMKGSAE